MNMIMPAITPYMPLPVHLTLSSDSESSKVGSAPGHDQIRSLGIFVYASLNQVSPKITAKLRFKTPCLAGTRHEIQKRAPAARHFTHRKVKYVSLYE